MQQSQTNLKVVEPACLLTLKSDNEGATTYTITIKNDQAEHVLTVFDPKSASSTSRRNTSLHFELSLVDGARDV